MRRRRRRDGAVAPEVKKVRKRFEDWRKRKAGRERIPDRLWALAARLCQAYSVHQVSSWLHVNHTALRDRVESVPARGRRRKKLEPAFVEWVTEGQGVPAAECVVELENARGLKMRIELRGAGLSDLSALARSLWSEES